MQFFVRKQLLVHMRQNLQKIHDILNFHRGENKEIEKIK